MCPVEIICFERIMETVGQRVGEIKQENEHSKCFEDYKPENLIGNLNLFLSIESIFEVS